MILELSLVKNLISKLAQTNIKKDEAGIGIFIRLLIFYRSYIIGNLMIGAAEGVEIAVVLFHFAERGFESEIS